MQVLLNKLYVCNFEVSQVDERLIIDKKDLIPIKNNLKKYIEDSNLITNFKGILLKKNLNL